MAEAKEPDLAEKEPDLADLDNFGNINIGRVSEQDFQEYFAHALKYKESHELWQEKRRTILLYKLGDNWRTLENKPGRHAEIVLIDSINNKITNGQYPVGNAENVEIYNSKSPCSECSTALEKFIVANPNFKFKIYFSNFFLHWYKKNEQGLRNLRQSGVELEPVIGVAMWKRFLWANRVPDEEQWKWLKVACSKERQAREESDRQIWRDFDRD